jgi:hypothetical protein
VTQHKLTDREISSPHVGGGPAYWSLKSLFDAHGGGESVTGPRGADGAGGWGSLRGNKLALEPNSVSLTPLSEHHDGRADSCCSGHAPVPPPPEEEDCGGGGLFTFISDN